MKVQLIVVQGKPEGKVIPLLGPIFKVGRGETCHLRPNSERVSREHAEFNVSAGRVVVRDLGSRNGTLVNGKALTQPHVLKDRDLVQVGPLTFAVSIQDEAQAPAAMAGSPVVVAPAAPAPGPSSSDIWPAIEAARPPGPRGSETIMIPAFSPSPIGRATSPIVADDDEDAEYERLPVIEGETSLDVPAFDSAKGEAVAPRKSRPEANARPGDRGSNPSATEILRRMMERGRNSK